MSIERTLQLIQEVHELSEPERNIVLVAIEAMKGTKFKRRQHDKIRRVIFPDGHHEDVENMTKFCRHHGLNQGAMSRVLLGHTKQHHGFRAMYVDAAFEPVQ